MKNTNKSFPELLNGQSIVDTHCHLDMEVYSRDLEEVLTRANHHGVESVISIGIDIESSQRAVDLARQYKGVYATIGVHPHDVDKLTEEDYTTLENLYEHQKEHIVAYGEIGLDYVKEYSPQDRQRAHFAKQLELAAHLQQPIVVHNREADDDTLAILKSGNYLENGGVMHCFSGDYVFARHIINLGMMISIPGIVTFKNATTLHDVVKKVPLDHLLIETDGPFLSPHPYRGKRNEPVNVLYTAAAIADIKNTSIEEVARATTLNAQRLFNL